MTGPLEGRTALVTGASSGVGRSLALALAAAGARVALGARRMEMLQEVAEEARQAGGEALALRFDVADEASILAGYARAEAAWGVVDTVVVNAGVSRPASAIALETSDLDWMLQVNLRGAFLTAREGARRMIKAGVGDGPGGRIVMISSIAARTVLPASAVYCATKAGLVMLAKSFAREWASQGVTVNVVCPGFMPTDIVGDWFSTEAGARQVARYPRKRLMPVEALSEAVVYLASEGAEATTGAVLTIDDGQSL